MHKDLTSVFTKMVDILKADERCVGGWHFGSVSRGMADMYSDYDPVFLIRGKDFESFAEDIPKNYLHTKQILKTQVEIFSKVAFIDTHLLAMYNRNVPICPSGGMADAVDSKSTMGNHVGVQVPSRAKKPRIYHEYEVFLLHFLAAYYFRFLQKAFAFFND